MGGFSILLHSIIYLMLISLCLFLLFGSLGIISALMVIFSKNPVFSVLFLILSFFNLSVLLLLLGLDFLPITFLIVYVGAIAVLFLFVLIMLNIKISELREGTKHYLLVSVFLASFFLCALITIFYFEFIPLDFSDVPLSFLQDQFLLLTSCFDFSI
jgi:NADH-quinone oxidoreductase subunit J